MELEKLDIYDYKIIIGALNFFESELYHLEIEQEDYEKLVSKLERNLDKLENNFDR